MRYHSYHQSHDHDRRDVSGVENEQARVQAHQKKGATGFDGDTEVTGACRVLGDSLNLRETSNCQSRTGTRGLIKP